MEQRAIRSPGAPVDLDRTRRMIEGARRMRALIRELLDSSRAEHGSLLGELDEVDVAEVAREAVARGQQRSLPLTCQADVVALIRGDRARLEQVLDNLLENGVKYSPQGGEVRVAVEVIDNEVCVMVAEGGVGISTEGGRLGKEGVRRG